MSDLSSLTQVLRHSGGQVRFFDMGRRVRKLTSELFEKVENQQTPYPYPYLQHAWIALMIWNPKNKEQGVAWFLKLPLDEQGFLIQAVRDDLLGRLLKNAGSILEHKETGEAPEDALKDNPFSFKPDPEKMALFHAYSTLASGQPASQYFENAQQYFAGQTGFDNWQSLGFQGIADLVVRHQKGNNSKVLTNAIPLLPDVPFEVLCTCLESIEPDHTLFEALCLRAEQTLQRHTAGANHIAAITRGLSNGKHSQRKQAIIKKILESDYALEAEVIVAIATRCSESLQDPDLLSLFLERLAIGKAGQAGFSRVLSDLMFMPTLRALILMQFRNEERSDALSQAIGEMFGANFN
ncbi:MAG: hypothetical protein CSA60_00840 [Neptuniibacter caesariensis]|uniref:DUF3549 domain-containing protein n=1 Tax=Neptuniibacter caesariensis TaxID=207954 RepID=A0A2G6JPH0_NEPCE|nr:MAG: hypothetical protein CSA60_00840 [Neptuniibacter caesariensis]